VLALDHRISLGGIGDGDVSPGHVDATYGDLAARDGGHPPRGSEAHLAAGRARLRVHVHTFGVYAY
jgi:hypothetical protein